MTAEASSLLPMVTASRAVIERRKPCCEERNEDSSFFDYSSSTDETVLEGIRRGDHDAVTALFKRYGRNVYNISLRILRDRSEADDLRQEVFLYLHERAHLYDPTKGSAASWIVQITYHRAINRRRYLAVRQHYNSEQIDDDRISSSRQSVDMNGIDARSLLSKLKEELTVAQRVTLELHHFEGYTFREIAELTGESLGNVRNHYYRGIDRLRLNVFEQKAHGEKMGAKTTERG
jgi:RNA polymerase sigma-70 factor, ECF subfamily